jgi:hypothetical protein
MLGRTGQFFEGLLGVRRDGVIVEPLTPAMHGPFLLQLPQTEHEVRAVRPNELVGRSVGVPLALLVLEVGVVKVAQGLVEWKTSRAVEEPIRVSRSHEPFGFVASVWMSVSCRRQSLVALNTFCAAESTFRVPSRFLPCFHVPMSTWFDVSVSLLTSGALACCGEYAVRLGHLPAPAVSVPGRAVPYLALTTFGRRPSSEELPVTNAEKY